MPEQTVVFKCKMGEMVKLRGNDVAGTGNLHAVGQVVGLQIDEDGVQWIDVRYTDTTGNRQIQWFRVYELILAGG